MKRFFIFIILIILLLVPRVNLAEELSSYEQKLVEKVKDVFDTEKELTFDLPVCATPIFLEVKAAEDKLSLQAKKILETYVSRPGAIWDPHDTLDTPSGHFRIHYTTEGIDAVYQKDVDNDGNGVPDYVDSCAEFLDYTWSFEVDTLGYKPPPSDSFYPPDNGGDGKYDVYLKNMGKGYYGYTEPELLYPGSDRSKTSFIALRNDYSYFLYLYDNIYEPLKATIAHEFFHTIHFSYDADEGIPDGQYWMEISAVWMEDQVFDEVNDYLNYLPWFYNYPWLSLKTFSDELDEPIERLHPYASCVWAFFLSEKFNDKDIIKKIWEKCGETKGPNAMEATDEILKDTLYKSSFENAFREFTVWNYFIGDRAVPDKFYSEGETFKDTLGNPLEIKVQDSFSSYPVDTNSNSYIHPPQYLGANYVVFKPQNNEGGLRLEFTGESEEWKISAAGYNPFNPEPSIVEFDVDSLTNYGLAEIYDWTSYSEIVMIPAVVTREPGGYFSYRYLVDYDSSLHGEKPFPSKDVVYQNFPNPFVIDDSDSYTFFRFSLSNPTRVRIDIFTSSGERVKTIHSKSLYPTGNYVERTSAIPWDGRNESGEYVSSGIYLYHVKTNNTSVVKKLVVIR